MKLKLFSLFLLITSSTIYSQSDIPQDYFRAPMDIPLVLSGTFGELRSNHFHSGLDIKTQQRTGVPVYAAADGVVSRIKVSHYGYGKAIYVSHPNGYTSVYAHVKEFCPEIETYIKEKQYEKEDFEIEVFPTAEELQVSKGELIAYSGNTGGSGGPHLHFELRDKNERPMNPFLFGIDVTDTKTPQVRRVMAYPVGPGAHINGSELPVELRLTKKSGGTYVTENIKAKGNIGFGVTTVDQQDGANNKNGIYSINTFINGNHNFGVTMDKFSFAETRYLNRMIDYGFFQDKRSRIQKLFVEPNNPLSIYNKIVDSGELNIEDSLSYEYGIRIRDFKNNEVHIQVPITGTNDTIINRKKIAITDHYVQSSNAYSYSDGKYEIYVPKGALYEDAYLDIQVSGDTLKLHEDEIPVHKNITLSYDLNAYDAEDRTKLYLGRINYKGDVYYSGARIKDNKLSASTRILGNYTVALDTTPPTIVAQNVTPKKWMSKQRYLKFKIDDTQSGIKGYRATVNGKFILMEYDYKTDSLVHDFDDNAVTDTENNFKLIVTDNVGNSATFETIFYRKR